MILKLAAITFLVTVSISIAGTPVGAQDMALHQIQARMTDTAGKINKYQEAIDKAKSNPSAPVKDPIDGSASSLQSLEAKQLDEAAQYKSDSEAANNIATNYATKGQFPVDLADSPKAGTMTVNQDKIETYRAASADGFMTPQELADTGATLKVDGTDYKFDENSGSWKSADGKTFNYSHTSNDNIQLGGSFAPGTNSTTAAAASPVVAPTPAKTTAALPENLPDDVFDVPKAQIAAIPRRLP